jgi:hypothetical protein
MNTRTGVVILLSIWTFLLTVAIGTAAYIGSLIP